MYGDPAALNPVGSSVEWLQGALLGSMATAAGVMAIAAVGFLMLTGRIEVRRAVQAIVGCFILFGASSIAHGILAGLNGLGTQQVTASDVGAGPMATLPPQISYPQKAPQPFDPYAGAAVPSQQ